MKALVIVACLCCVATESDLWAEPFSGQLVQVEVMPGQLVTGELGRENASHIELLNLATGKTIIYMKSQLLLIKKEVSETAAKQAVGLDNYVAWMVRKKTPNVSQNGSVAEVGDGGISITLGSKHKIVKDQKLEVSRVTGTVKDPKTGKVLGQRRKKVATLVVTDVAENFSMTKVLKGFRKAIQKGDQVAPQVASNAVAIFPMVEINGQNSKLGLQMAGRLTTNLVRLGVPVVERTLLADVLVELAIQQTSLFDPAKAQQCGKLLGAFAVLTGTVNQNGQCQLRLIDVTTGRILFAVGHKMTVAEIQRLTTDEPGVTGVAGTAGPPATAKGAFALLAI